MSVNATPPGWAEVLLRAFLTPGDSDSVSGDLLEQYRESVRPACGRRRADIWYVQQVLGFVWRNARLWAALFAAAFIARTALDWLAPPADFHARANVSTLLGAGIVLLAGFRVASRSGSFAAGPVIGVATAAIAAPIEVMGAVTLLAGWHDPMTMAAIRGSGGLEEVLTLPLLMVLPGIVLGTIGGLLGAAVKRLRSV
jgi:hypothetical protein